MTAGYLAAPGLLAHVFLAADSQDASAGWDHLRSLWDDVTRSFALRAISAFEVPARLSPRNLLPPDGYRLLAAAESDADAIWQALAWADHDLLCVTVMLAPPRGVDCAPTWSSLERRWGGIVSRLPPAAVIGESRILLALLAGEDAGVGSRDDDATIVRTLELVRKAVTAMQEPSTAGWWRHWDTVRLGSAHEQAPVWEIGPGSAAGRSARRLVVVAPEELERQVDYFLWTHGDGSPTPLTRHLMHAARLRHQIRVFDKGKAASRLRRELGALVDDVSGQWAASSDLAWRSVERDRLSAGLARSRVASVALRAKMDAMRTAVGVNDQNMMRAVSVIAADVAVGPLSEDHQIAIRLRQRLDDEIAMLDSATENARRAASLLSGEVSAPLPVVSAFPLPRPVNGHATDAPRVKLPPSPPVFLAPPPAARPEVSLAHPRADMPAPWVVILTALAVEYEAVKKYLAGPVRSRGERGTLYETGELPAGAHRSWRVAIAQTGPGSATAGMQLERAIGVFQPKIALFVGVAGGRKDVSRGDVVVADRVYDYESGKSELEGFRPRMGTYQPAYRLVQQAQLIVRESRWQLRILPACPQPPPRAFVKPIATGAKVVANDKSEIALLLDRIASDALAVETEGHGFLESAYMNPGVDALVIRGISDLLTGKDQAGDDYWQPIASQHAAAFAVELLNALGMDTP